jgi:hypothetical protein
MKFLRFGWPNAENLRASGNKPDSICTGMVLNYSGQIPNWHLFILKHKKMFSRENEKLNKLLKLSPHVFLGFHGPKDWSARFVAIKKARSPSSLRT